MKSMKQIILAAVVLLLSLFSAPAFAIDCSTCSGSSNLDSQQAIECGSSCASGNSQNPQQATKQVNSTLKTVINIISVVAGIAGVIMIIVGGLRYVTSGGSSEKVSGAKNTILYAVIGLFVVAIAQIIVRFVLTNATK